MEKVGYIKIPEFNDEIRKIIITWSNLYPPLKFLQLFWDDMNRRGHRLINRDYYNIQQSITVTWTPRIKSTFVFLINVIGVSMSYGGNKYSVKDHCMG